MSQGSDDLTPRPAPCPSENKAAVIVPSVPDVSMIFDSASSNNIRPQSFMTTPNFSRPIFNRPAAKFEPIIEQDHHPQVKSPPPVIFGHSVEYHQQYLSHQHQSIQQSEMKQQHYAQQCELKQHQYAQQSAYVPSPPPQQSAYAPSPPPQQHQICSCYNFHKLASSPHIVSAPPPNEIPTEALVNTPLPSAPPENPEMKEILEILKNNQSELRQINENNERNRKLSENLLLDLQDYKKTITTILNKQNTIESKISEMETKINENLNVIQTMISTKLTNCMFNNNFESENRQILPKHMNNGKLIFNNRTEDDNRNKFILNDCKNAPIFGQQKSIFIERNSPPTVEAGAQANGDMKELFNKYEIKGALNRRSIDYSVSSLNYLQRYGLLEEHK